MRLLCCPRGFHGHASSTAGREADVAALLASGTVAAGVALAQGVTPLYAAARNGHAGVMKLLLRCALFITYQ